MKPKQAKIFHGHNLPLKINYQEESILKCFYLKFNDFQNRYLIWYLIKLNLKSKRLLFYYLFNKIQVKAIPQTQLIEAKLIINLILHLIILKLWKKYLQISCIFAWWNIFLAVSSQFLRWREKYIFSTSLKRTKNT